MECRWVQKRLAINSYQLACCKHRIAAGKSLRDPMITRSLFRAEVGSRVTNAALNDELGYLVTASGLWIHFPILTSNMFCSENYIDFCVAAGRALIEIELLAIKRNSMRPDWVENCRRSHKVSVIKAANSIFSCGNSHRTDSCISFEPVFRRGLRGSHSAVTQSAFWYANAIMLHLTAGLMSRSNDD